MSHESEIIYLQSIKNSNNTLIENNLASIVAYDSAISSFQAQIESYQQLQTDLTTANTQLSANNSTIDDIITILST